MDRDKEAEALAAMRLTSKSCQACPLWKNATQTVFGEGPSDAKLMLVGEQPGDKEDLAGKPFVGPAGRLLRKLLQEAEIDDDLVYLTNAVKHFKWEPKGARRIHKRPNLREVAACYPWLQREIQILQPQLVVCLGATASQALLGKSFRVTQSRGQFISMDAGFSVMATIHPSALLRMRPEIKAQEIHRFVDDLRKAASFIKGLPSSRTKLI